MKKIFILSLLLAPIVAHATDPVGPSAVGQGETAVIATAGAPYAITAPAQGDTTNVVSASYVKGAYNDAIAAINNVANKVSIVDERVDNLFDQVNDDMYDAIDSKQDKLVFFNSNQELGNVTVAEVQLTSDQIFDVGLGGDILPEVENSLTTLGGVALGVQMVLDRKGVNAVTTWGSNTTTAVPLINN